MKKIVSLLAVVLAGVVAGCGSVGGIFTPHVATVPVLGTNTVITAQPVVTAALVTNTLADGQTVTNSVVVTNTVLTTNLVTVTNMVQQTNYTVSQTASNYITGAQAINGITSVVDPYSAPIGLALAGLSGVLGFWARMKSKQAAMHSSVSQTIITAVEQLEPAIGAGVKAAVTATAAKQGTSAAVQNVVAAVTANL
jgi:hypothetical protein